MNFDRFNSSEIKRKQPTCETCGAETNGEDDDCEKCQESKDAERKEALREYKQNPTQTDRGFVRVQPIKKIG